jgi:hypothetical protein
VRAGRGCLVRACLDSDCAGRLTERGDADQCPTSSATRSSRRSGRRDARCAGPWRSRMVAGSRPSGGRRETIPELERTSSREEASADITPGSFIASLPKRALRSRSPTRMDGLPTKTSTGSTTSNAHSPPAAAEARPSGAHSHALPAKPSWTLSSGRSKSSSARSPNPTSERGTNAQTASASTT